MLKNRNNTDAHVQNHIYGRSRILASIFGFFLGSFGIFYTGHRRIALYWLIANTSLAFLVFLIPFAYSLNTVLLMFSLAFIPMTLCTLHAYHLAKRGVYPLKRRWLRYLVYSFWILGGLGLTLILQNLAKSNGWNGNFYFTISQDSQLPLLPPHASVIATRHTVSDHWPEQGALVIFSPPAPSQDDSHIQLIGRVIAKGPAIIDLKNGQLMINGDPVTRTAIKPFFPTDRLQKAGYPPHVAQMRETLPNGKSHRIIKLLGEVGLYDISGPIAVPEKTVFILHDNRDRAFDSRIFGPVPFQNILGEPHFFTAPAERFGDPLRGDDPL